MIKPEQIPDEVVERFLAALYGEPGLPYRKALAAALAAWPDMVERHYPNDPTRPTGIFLPLPKDGE
jgi:hypothetical protein